MFGCVLNGAVMSLFAIFYSQIFEVCSRESADLLVGATFWSMMFLVLGFIRAIAFMISMYSFGKSGEMLTLRLRIKAFTNVLRQDVTYFDDSKHDTGKICARLATDAPNVRFAVGGRVSNLIAACFSMIAGVVIEFVYGWKLALVVTAMLPLLIASGWIDLKLNMTNQTSDTELMEEAGKTAVEGIENVLYGNTVQALTLEKTLYQTYCHHLQKPYRETLTKGKQAHVYGASYAFSQSMIFFMPTGTLRQWPWRIGTSDVLVFWNKKHHYKMKSIDTKTQWTQYFDQKYQISKIFCK